MNATTYDFARSFLRFRVDLAEQAAITLSHKPPTTVNNARDWAEFIVQAHTPVSAAVTVNHYSKPRRIANTDNALLMLF